ncbi:ThiF family adenylyltransferase [bacterium]|nr:ThiF family adenylyltransferase [bacterium]MCI0566492.1 ThiF family adenylyltransferase [bacterium]
MKHIKAIGLGGIGNALLPPLCRFLNFESDEPWRVTLIDGDDFEEKNAKRQSFAEFGNKARVMASSLAREFTEVSFRSISEFVKPENVADVIGDGDIVLLAVDNHETRKLVSDHCEKLQNTVLISGGNELTDGNVAVHIRKDGVNVTVPITAFHPEIRNAAGKTPGEMSCEERAARPETKQVIVTNMQAAVSMLTAFYHIAEKRFENVGETYFDIMENKLLTKDRRAV